MPDWPKTIPEPTVEQVAQRVEMGLMIVGDPDQCAKATQVYEDIGADQLTFGMLSSTMPIEMAVEAVETYGKHVIPKYDTDPVHSTTRQREAQVGATV